MRTLSRPRMGRLYGGDVAESAVLEQLTKLRSAVDQKNKRSLASAARPNLPPTGPLREQFALVLPRHAQIEPVSNELRAADAGEHGIITAATLNGRQVTRIDGQAGR